MTQEQKDLLIKDLCGRLSHGVKCKILETNEVKIIGSIQYDGENTLFDFWEDEQKIQYGHQLYLSEFKPCLFPLSSMTEEQKYEFYLKFIVKDCDCVFDYFKFCLDDGKWHKLLTSLLAVEEIIDWFHKNHIDYRGLIPMGLAIDATGLNIY